MSAALWGVGCFRAAGETVTFPVGEADLQRDIATAQKNLATLGVTAGSRALLTSLLSESAQYWPVQIGLLMAGTQMSCADASRFDAFRTAMFLRGPRYDTAIGINGDVLDGLDDLGAPISDLFARVPVVAARADAATRLREAGLRPRLWLHLGPTIAAECEATTGAHVDEDEWVVETRADEVVISARRERAAGIVEQATGVLGEIVTDPCACGRADARVRLGS